MAKQTPPVFVHKVASPVGVVTVASDGESIVGLWIEGQKYFARTIEAVRVARIVPVLKQAEVWLDSYFAGLQPGVELPLAPRGTAFQQEVWGILRDIPHGELLTYGDIARIIAKRQGKQRMSAQAVGGAVGRNPISIIIPCHRVVGSDGSLTGYAGGVAVKQQLLKHEGVDVGKLYLPTKGTAL